jgi:hypothetical protein
VVSWEDAQKQAANNKRMPVQEGVGSGSGPAANKRRYRWPANTVIYIYIYSNPIDEFVGLHYIYIYCSNLVTT